MDVSCGSPFAWTKAIFCCLCPGSEDQAQEQNHQPNSGVRQLAAWNINQQADGLQNHDGIVQMLEPANETQNNKAERECL
jgi:hypothetical protein